MKVLLLGGTGAMGVYLGKLLADKGVDTYITSRSERTNEDNITYVKGNARELSFTQKLIAEHWDAIVDFMIYDTETFKSRVNLLLNATSQYVYLSSSRVYAESKDRITEESPRLLDVTTDKEYLATDEYALTKARQENILRESSKNNWTIIRPYITYGKERLQLGVLEKEYWLKLALNGNSIVFNEDIASKVTTLTSGYDVAHAMAELIGNPKAYGEAFHITNNKPIHWSKVLDLYVDVLGKHLGAKPNVKFISLSKFISCFSTPYQVKYDRLFNRKFDNSKIGQFIDLNSFVEPEQGLREMLMQFLQNPKFKRGSRVPDAQFIIKIGEGKLLDRITVLLGLLKRTVIRASRIIKLK